MIVARSVPEPFTQRTRTSRPAWSETWVPAEVFLPDVLKKDWGYKGFVISDWGGTHSTAKASAAGMDQEQPMADFFGPALMQAVKDGKVPMAEIDDHARRVLYAEFLSGIVDNPIEKGVVDVERGLDIAQHLEEESIVLLKNDNRSCPWRRRFGASP